MTDMHPDVQTVLETYAPGDMALLPEKTAGLAYCRLLRLQANPFSHYADTDARWIMQAFRLHDALQKADKECKAHPSNYLRKLSNVSSKIWKSARFLAH